MAKKSKGGTLAPAQRRLTFRLTGATGETYIDLAQCLSAVNRRLYRQGKCYYVSKIDLAVLFPTPPSVADPTLPANQFVNTNVIISAIPDSWVAHNAWKKCFAVWQKMNRNVLKDNPSIKGTWADYKMFMDVDHYNGGANSAGPTLNLLPIDVASNEIQTDEWYMGRYVAPQHDVDVDVAAAEGTPKPADEYYISMLGDDVKNAAGEFNCVGAIKAYQDTRAMVQVSPDVPALMQDSWLTRLTDEGSQDPELANVLEDANDHPPYDIDKYPGGENNQPEPLMMGHLFGSLYSPKDKTDGFKVPLGLLKINHEITGNASLTMVVDLMPGTYKGVAATEMGQ